MSETAIIKKVRKSNTSPTGAPCNSCPAVGLPILPVRYAVVPKSQPGALLPSSCSQALLDPADQSKLQLKNSRYALRAMREGFLYLHYQDPDTQRWTWHCYMISPSGALRQIPLSTPGPVQVTEMSCQREAHVVNSSIISINKPEKVNKVFIAYSEHFWTEKTRERLGKHGNRFIEFSPSAWLAQKNQKHAFTPQQIEQSVVDYGEQASVNGLKASPFEVLKRRGQAPSLAKRMDAILDGQGAVIAIPDPIGCTRELNTQRLEVYNEYRTYHGDPEIAWKRSCAMQVQGLRDYVEAQAKEQLKDAKTKYYGRGLIKTKNQQIDAETKRGWARFEDHYSEASRTAFLKDFKKWCDTFVQRISQWDADYAPWLDSESLALVMQDHDLTDESNRQHKTSTAEFLLAGGVLSQASHDVWVRMLEKDVTHLKNYAISGILQNQPAWVEGFKAASHTTVGDYLVGNIGKGFDISRNTAESAGMAAKSAGVNDGANKLVIEAAARLLNITNGAISALLAKSDQLTTEKIAALEALQAKMGLAYARTQANIDVVLLKVELTVAEWYRVITSHLKQSLQGTVKTVGDTLSQMATAAMMQVPAGSDAGQKLVSFAFWVAGTPKEVEGVLMQFGQAASGVVEKVGSGTGQLIRAGTSAASAGAHGGAAATVGGVKNTLRGVQVVAHNLKKGTSYILKIPARVLPAKAVAFASAATGHGLTVMGTMDVRLAFIGAGFQSWSLWNGYKDYQTSIGFKASDTSWAIASAGTGLLGATLDVVSKATIAVKGQNAVISMIGIRVAASRVVTTGGILGALASFVDCGQAIMKAYTFGKRGDGDASRYQMGVALFAAIGGGAGVAIAFGSTALLGPVGILIACIAIGVVLTYLAFMAEDSAVEVWLDRCRFGKGARAEGRFKSIQQECDSLELVGRNVTIETEWRDNLLGSPDEIAIVIKRPADKGDAINFGVLLQGEGFVRQLCYLDLKQSGTPILVQAKVDQPTNTEAKEATYTVTNAGGTRTVELSLQVSPIFNKAKIWLRYIPDAGQPAAFHDDVLLLAD